MDDVTSISPSDVALPAGAPLPDTTSSPALVTGTMAQALRAAEIAMQARRWSDAAELLAPLASIDPGTGVKLRISRNLACLQVHRPAVYEMLLSLPSDDRYGIGTGAQNRPTVFVTRDDGSRICLSPNHDPVGASQSSFKSLGSAISSGTCIGFCGTGDGYLLQLLAMHPPKLFMDMEQPVFFIENEPQVLLQCLMIHDFSGPRGPIEQPRFLWFVGADWKEQLFDTCLNDPQLPCPAVTASQGLLSSPMAQALERLAETIIERDRDVRRRVENWYASLNTETLGELFGMRSSRQPRVLILTTRFSTVLQYSSRDVAAAYSRIGWEVRILIEPSPVHRLMNVATRLTLDDFRPDLVFQIDHLRYEHPEMFPSNLPFVCWIQDHLPNLRTRQAAASIGPRDVVLTDAQSMYVGTFGYPARQCIGLTKLTNSASSHPEATANFNCEDLVFVSNASHVPEEILRDRIEGYGGSVDGKRLLEASSQRLLSIYQSGRSVDTYFEILQLMREARVELRSILATDESDAIAAWLAHPFNDALYRQQAIGWAAQAALEMGLSLGLYGRGWESHPTLRSFARGPIAYGPALEQLTCGARFNLQIVPYLCLHQRLLDGLSAGGFYLIRAHTSDLDTQRLLDFVDRHCPASTSVAAANAVLPSALRSRFRTLCELARPAIATSEQDDPVEAVKQWAQMQLLIPREQVLPRFDLNSFCDAASFRSALTRFMADPSLRDELQTAQRNRVLSHFTYEGRMRRVTKSIHELFMQKDLTIGCADRRAV